MILAPVTAGDHAGITALLNDCFGPERHFRTAYRLRDQATRIDELSRLMRANDGRLLGSIQYWRLKLAGENAVRPLTLLGPLAVTPSARRHGVGRRLMDATLALADARDYDPIMLIGDHSYYGRFGFDAALTGGWQLPGPVERQRLLLRTQRRTELPVHAEVRGSRPAPITPQPPAEPVTAPYTVPAAV